MCSLIGLNACVGSGVSLTHPSGSWPVEDLMGTQLLTVALMEPDEGERAKLLNAAAAFVSKADFFSVVEALRFKEYANCLRIVYGFDTMASKGGAVAFDAPMAVKLGCVQIQVRDSTLLWGIYHRSLYSCPLGRLIDVEAKRCATCKRVPPVGKKFPKCGRCLTMRYCTKACQLEDFFRHKPSCLVAARAMKMGLEEHLAESNALIEACSKRLGVDLQMREKTPSQAPTRVPLPVPGVKKGASRAMRTYRRSGSGREGRLPRIEEE
eukprot:jgi/Mesvir1/20217/Mv13455-RA.1